MPIKAPFFEEIEAEFEALKSQEGSSREEQLIAAKSILAKVSLVVAEIITSEPELKNSAKIFTSEDEKEQVIAFKQLNDCWFFQLYKEEEIIFIENATELQQKISGELFEKVKESGILN